MSIRMMISLALGTLLAGAEFSNSAHAGLLSYEIKVDTSGLVSGPGGLIDVNLGVAFPPGSSSVSATVFGPVTDGTLGVATPISGTAAGDLTTPGGVTLNNTSSTNELTQDFQVHSFFDVFVTIQGPEIGAGAVGPWSGTVLDVTIFDSGTGFESALFFVNPNVDANGNPIIDGTIGIIPSDDLVQVIPLGQTVPDPSTFVLLGLGLQAVVAVGRRRKRHSA